MTVLFMCIAVSCNDYRMSEITDYQKDTSFFSFYYVPDACCQNGQDLETGERDVHLDWMPFRTKSHQVNMDDDTSDCLCSHALMASIDLLHACSATTTMIKIKNKQTNKQRPSKRLKIKL